MDGKTFLALWGSIGKWKGIVLGLIGDEGGINCPLCEEFCNEDLDHLNCLNCPVYLETGLSMCEGTPYPDWTEHWHDEHAVTEKERNRDIPWYTECLECTKLAEEMVAFLEGLLP